MIGVYRPRYSRDRSVVLLVIQPTPFCNIDCSYCYLANRTNRARIDSDTVRQIFRQTLAFCPEQLEFDVSWHAGEPTVLPPDWYERMFTLIEAEIPQYVSIRHGFQTNATLLNDEWCDFFKRKDISVGVSVDGPQEIHDSYRRTRGGSGTFSSVMAGIDRLRAHDLPFHVITVLSARSLKAPEAIFSFYESIGVNRINFNFEEIEGRHGTSSLSVPGMIEHYKRFLRKFCTLMRTKKKDWTVREVGTIYGRAFSPDAPENFQATPGRILCFDWQGNVSTFSPELLTVIHPRYGDFALGNINHRALDAMIEGDKARAIAVEIADGIALCRSECGYFEVCGGGAPSSKLCENGSFASAETMHCRFRVKATTDAILEIMRDQILDARRVPNNA